MTGEQDEAGGLRSGDRFMNATLRMGLPQLRELLRRQVGDAARALRDPDLSDEAIHRIRKLLKRARANLRLLRTALGEQRYARENAALRDAARPLSGVRDAAVIVETIDDLRGGGKNPSRNALLVKLRGTLEKERLAARERLKASGNAHKSADALDRAWRRIDRWRLPRTRPSALAKGVERIYRRTRKALRVLDADCSAENLHEWRKQVKYLGHALESLNSNESRDGDFLREALEDMGMLGERLGDDHDLVVLQQRFAKLHSGGARTGLFADIAARQKKLRSRALKDGRKVFIAKPKAFSKSVGKIL